MEDSSAKLVKRLDALLGIALIRTGGANEQSLSENVKYLRNLRFSNKEIADILGKTTHHIEVEASKLARQGKIQKHKGGSHGRKGT